MRNVIVSGIQNLVEEQNNCSKVQHVIFAASVCCGISGGCAVVQKVNGTLNYNQKLCAHCADPVVSLK